MAMTKFEREWLENALREDGEIRDGALYWKKSGNVAPNDTAEEAIELGYKIDMEKHRKAREEYVNESLEEYRKNWQPPSEEELFEMRAAFGTGVTIVDVISGHRIAL